MAIELRQNPAIANRMSYIFSSKLSLFCLLLKRYLAQITFSIELHSITNYCMFAFFIFSVYIQSQQHQP